MKQQCLEAVANAAGRSLKKGEADSIAGDIKNASRVLARLDRDKWTSMSKGEQTRAAAQYAINELRGGTALKNRRLSLSVGVWNRISDFIDNAMKRPGVDVFTALHGYLADSPVGRVMGQAMEGRIRRINDEYQARFVKQLEGSKYNVFDLIKTKQGTDALIHEMYDQDSRKLPDITPEIAAAAKEGAKIWKGLTDDIRELANRLGMDIGDLKDRFRFPQGNDSEMVRDMGEEAYINHYMDWLDRSQYVKEDGSLYSDDEMREMIKEGYATEASDGIVREESNKSSGFSGMLANRRGQSRVYHYKNAESYIASRENLSRNNMRTTMMNHITGLSRDIGAMEYFGPNAANMFKQWVTASRRRALEGGMSPDDINNKSIQLQRQFDWMTGAVKAPTSNAIAHAFDITSNILVKPKLALRALFTSMLHYGTGAVEANYVGLSNLDLLRNYREAMTPGSHEREQFDSTFHMGLESYTNDTSRDAYDMTGPAWSAHWANSIIKASGLLKHLEAMKRAFSKTFFAHIGDVVGRLNYADLKGKDLRVLNENGITETHYNILKAAQQEDYGGNNKTMLTPQSIYDVPDEKIASIINPQLEQMKGDVDFKVKELSDLQDKLTGFKDNKRQAVNDRIDSLEKMRQDFIDTRAKYLKEAHDAAAGKIDDFAETRNKYLSDMGDHIDNQIELAKEKVRLAETNSDFAAYLKTRDTTDKMSDMLNDAGEADQKGVDRLSDKSSKVVQDYGNQRNSLGEKLGQRRAESEAKIRMLEQKLKDTGKLFEAQTKGKASTEGAKLGAKEKQFVKEIKAKGLEFDNRIRAHLSDIDAYTKNYNDKMEKIQAVSQSHQEALGPRMQQAIKDARRDTVLSYLGMVDKHARNAVITPTSTERFQYGPEKFDKNTFAGAIARSVYAFKMIPQAQMMRMIERFQTLPDGASKARYLAAYIAGVAIPAMMVLQTEALEDGKDVLKMNSMNFLGDILLKGGMLGNYTDFILNGSDSDPNESIADKLEGPLISTVSDLIKLVKRTASEVKAGQDIDTGPQLLSFLKNNAGVTEIWYVKAILDRMIWNNFYEGIAPGHMARVVERARQHGQSYYNPPNQLLPNRPPDLSGAIQ